MAEELADVQAEQNQQIIQDTPSSAEKPVIGKVDDPGKPEKRPSLRDTLKKSFEDARADSTGRLHATKDGKFVQKPSETKPVEAPKEAAPADKQTTTDASPAPASAPAAGPPPGWSAESKAAFNALPDHLKSDVLKREKEVSDGFKSKSDELKKYQALEQVLARRRSQYQHLGLPDDVATDRLYGWAEQVQQAISTASDPEQAVQNISRVIAQSYGIRSNAQSTPSPQEEIPPQFKPVLDQLGRINQDVSSLKTDYQRWQEQQTADVLRNFAKDKPHFEKVRQRMGQLMVGGLATDLESAYQSAVLLDPEVAAEMAKAKEAEAEQKRREAAEKAAKAAISPSSRAPSTAAALPSKANGIRGAILKSIDEVRGSGRA